MTAQLKVDEPGDQPGPVLCTCGWGNLLMRPSEIPEKCPLCGYLLRRHFGLAEEDGDE